MSANMTGIVLNLKRKVTSSASVFTNYARLLGNSHPKNETQENYRTAPMSYEAFVNLRRKQAKQSVLILLQRKRDIHKAYRYLAQHGEFAAFSYDLKYSYLFVEYTEKSSVQGLLKSLSCEEFLTRSRFLCFDGKGKQNVAVPMEKHLPIEHEDLKGPSIVRLKPLNTISEQIEKHHQMRSISDLGYRLRYFVCSLLEDSVSNILPPCRIEPFGSSVNGFGWRKSDLDMLLQIKPESNENQFSVVGKPATSITTLALIADIVSFTMPACNSVKRILRARVPIIKFVHQAVGIDCDLSNSSFYGAHMSELMYTLGECDWRVRPLITVMKHWARASKVSREGPSPWPTNFLLMLMMVFYLQTARVLPSLEVLRAVAGIKDCGHSFILENLPTSDNTQSLEELLSGFFQFYVEFDFEQYGLSLLKGTQVEKPDLVRLLCIEDPLLSDSLIRNSVSKKAINSTKNTMRLALKILKESSPNSNAPWGLMTLLQGSGEGRAALDFQLSNVFST